MIGQAVVRRDVRQFGIAGLIIAIMVGSTLLAYTLWPSQFRQAWHENLDRLRFLVGR